MKPILFKTGFLFAGDEFEALTRVKIDTGVGPAVALVTFEITIGDYLSASWTPHSPLVFENRSASGYGPDHRGYKLKDITPGYLEGSLIPKVFQQMYPAANFPISPSANTGFVTPEEIRTLPPSVKAYIQDLETRCDPSGDVQTIASLKEQVKSLTARLASQKHQDMVTLAAGALSGLCSSRAHLSSSEIAEQARNFASSTWHALHRN